MNEDLSTAQRLQMAAMLTDALSNLLDRSNHLCRSTDQGSDIAYCPKPQYEDHEALLRNTVELTAATITETIQALVPTQSPEKVSDGA